MHVLSGLRVVDLSQHRTGTQASQLLADFGADVQWVEPPGGSGLRESPAYPFYCRGKSSVELDLHDPTDLAQALALANDADVLIECFRPGVADRLGLGYDVLSTSNPRLVYASITGFGRTGPLAQLKAYEGVVQAKIGVFKAFERIADTEHPPFITVPWCSFSASQLAIHGIIAALVERERSGCGQRVETTLAQGFAALDTWDWFLDLITQRYPDAYLPSGAFQDGKPLSPLTYMLLIALTKDGHWLQFAQVAPRLFVALMEALGLGWTLTDPEWKGIPQFDDQERRSKLLTMMHEAAATKTLAEWEAIFDADPNVYAEVLRSGSAVLEHPQLVHDNHVVDIDEPDRGAVRQPAGIAEIKGSPITSWQPAPRLGEVRAVDRGDGSIAQPRPAGDATSAMPLAGITVLEFATMYAAPFGATLLTDLGARVIKVEPLTGDPIRMLMPFPESGGAKVMQGKESICVDITKPEGLAIVHQLTAQADLVLDGFRAGVAERIGIDAETLQRINPNAVWVSANGYGDGGPCGHRPAFAPSIGAAAGLVRANVGETIREVPGLSAEDILAAHAKLSQAAAIPQAQADGFAALGVATSLLLGLLIRERGLGAPVIASSMLATATHAMADQVVHAVGEPARPGVSAELRGLSALYRIYDASDGWVFLAAPTSADWDRLVDALAPYLDLRRDERFMTAELRDRNDVALTEVLAHVYATGPKDEWEKQLTAADVACVAVATDRPERFYQSDDIGRASGYITDVVHPTFDEHPRLAPLVTFSRSATQALPGVLAGSSTDAVLAELGYDDAAIAGLRERQIIGG